MIDKLIKHLEKRGYHKSGGHYKRETFGYWKTFSGVYQVAVLIYDWREHKARGRIAEDYGFQIIEDYSFQFKFVLGNGGPYSRWDMTICDDKMTIIKFEEICKAFYEGMVIP